MDNTTYISRDKTSANEAPLLTRALEICALLLVAATTLVYPLCLDDDLLSVIYQQLASTGLYPNIHPWVSCGFTPLILKESVLLTIAGPLLFLFAWIKIRGQWLGLEKPIFLNGSGTWWSRFLRTEPIAFIFVLYFAVSVTWSPIFQQSLHTWVIMATTVAVMMVLRSQATLRVFAVRFMVVVVGCGTILAGLALLQHLDKMSILTEIDDPRNRMSSLIGHNTGLSSWLMFPLSFAIYFALVNRRIWVKIANALVVILLVTVIVAAQSRAIWFLGLVILIAGTWRIMSLMGRRIPRWGIVGAIGVFGLIIFALSYAPQRNPLARLPVSLSQRVSGDILNLDQLRRETRLRILVVSLAELFPKSPLVGTGLGSFSWEYPKAQGDFFARYPNNWLGTTPRRTDLAHNEYLQVLTETGLIGLGLLILFAMALARESHKHYRALKSPHDRALWWALSIPVLAVAAHAFVDFPFHVAPIALVALVSVAMTTRISNASPLVDPDDTPPETFHSPRVATFVGLATSLVIFAWYPWAWKALVGNVYVSDIYYNSGVSRLNDFVSSRGQTSERRLRTLELARRSFRESIIANVFNGLAYEGQATTCLNRASFVLHELETRKDDLPTSIAENYRRGIERDAQSAITITKNQLESGGLRYHYTYYLLGRAWRMLWELEKDAVAPEDSHAYAEAVRHLRTALYYNVADSTSLRELSELLSITQKTADEGREMLEHLLEHDPWTADEQILNPAVELASIGEIESAEAMLHPVFADHPDHPRVLLAMAWLRFYKAVWPPKPLDEIGREAEYLEWRKQQLAPGWEYIQSLADDEWFQPRKERLTMLYTAAAGDISNAHYLARARISKNIWDREARAIYYWTDKALYGGGLKFEPSQEYQRTNALLTIYFMDDRKAGVSLGAMAADVELTLPEARRVAAFCEANNWWDLLSIGLPLALKTYPGDPELTRLATELQGRQGSQPSAE